MGEKYFKASFIIGKQEEKEFSLIIKGKKFKHLFN